MTSSGGPIDAIWDGEVFKPATPYMARRADKQFGRGEVLHLEHVEERSTRSHAHFFARVHEVWANLPPLQAERFKSPEHLRRWALIKAGYCDSQSMPCGTASAAKKFAAFIRPLDEFSVITVNGSVVNVFRAKSQSYRTMSKKEFQESKDKVLEIIADLIGVTGDELKAPSAAEYLAAG